MATYKVLVNDTEFALDPELVKSLDIYPPTNGNYHLLHQHTGYTIAVVETDFLAKALTLSVNGNRYHINIEDSYDQMVKEMGLLVNTAQKLNNIKAPMPGLILEVMVKPGDEITEGTPLLILSAMKMENMILSEGAGVVKSVEVKKGESVDKGQLVIEME